MIWVDDMTLIRISYPTVWKGRLLLRVYGVTEKNYCTSLFDRHDDAARGSSNAPCCGKV